MDKIWEFLKKIAMRRLPVWVLVTIIIVWTFAIVGCSIIPTSYTVTPQQKNIVKKNTLFQLEVLRRYNEDKLDKKTFKELLIQNAKFALDIEKIICGEVNQDTKRLFDNMLNKVKESKDKEKEKQ